MKKDIIKKIACILLVCFLSSVVPSPVLAADAAQILDQLTPKQKAMLQNLSPEQKNEIKNQLGKDNGGIKSGKTETIVEEKKDAALSEPQELKPIEGLPKNPDAEELSPIEKGYLEKVGEKTLPLKQFGYDVFARTVGQQFALTPSVPIGPDYKINSGDKLLITIWGNVNDSFSADVDERGAVTMPKIGVVSIAGLTISQAKTMLYNRLMNVFVTDFNIDLTVKEIGSIKVYLLGDFNKPGAYTVLANTSLYDAIFIGGGATNGGSLRKIELVRNGYTIKTVDLYNFVLTGSKKNDIPLKSGDVIKVPPIGRIVAISGNVNRPGIYELKTETELSDFMGLAGGITPTSYLQRIQIERKQKNIEQTAIDINYADYLKQKAYKPIYLQNLDFITVFSIEETIRSVVYLEGNVARPGRYQLKPNMSLLDLLVEAQGLAPGTYMERAQIYRLSPPDMRPQIIAIDLNKTKKETPDHNPKLLEYDRIRIYSEKELKGEPIVYISGELNDGDKFFPLTQGMKISDLVFRAGGVKESAYLDKSELVRIKDNGQTDTYQINLREILIDKDRSSDFLLEKNDYLFVRRIPDYGVNETMTISGNVLYPGKYAISKGERLSSVIARAGGFTQKAFLDGAVFVRVSLKGVQSEYANKFKSEMDIKRNFELSQIPIGLPSDEAQARAMQINMKYESMLGKITPDIPGRIIIDLDKLSPNNNNDLIVQNGDSLTIPDQTYAVNVLGEVYAPGTILYQRGKSLNYYTDSCGGGTEYADMGKALVLKANGRLEKNHWFLTIDSGDTILVPAKPIELTQYQRPFDWNDFWDNSMKATTAIAQTATALVTVYLLFKTVK